jgi:hypothetical protein
VNQKDEKGLNTTEWKLYNDTNIQFFSNWGEVVNFCVTSKCLPTLLFYEAYQGLQTNGDFDKFAIAEEFVDSLQITAMEQD